MDDLQDLMILVFGQSGCGKTTLVRERLAPKAPKPVVVLDPNLQWNDTSLLSVKSWTDVDPQGINVYQPDIGDSDEVFFRQVVQGKFHRFEHQTLVFDEVALHHHRFVAPEPLLRIAQRHRQLGLTIIACSQRPAHVDNAFSANAKAIICFRVVEPNDLKYLAAMGIPVGELAELGQHEFKEFRL